MEQQIHQLTISINEVDEKHFPYAEPWYQESFILQFTATPTKLFVVGDLPEKRKQVWIEFLKQGYPTKEIVWCAKTEK